MLLHPLAYQPVRGNRRPRLWLNLELAPPMPPPYVVQIFLMKQDELHSSNGRGLKPLSWNTFLFAALGSLVCMVHGHIYYYILALVGWGDGTSGIGISNPGLAAALITLPLMTYFLLGAIASTSARRESRIALAWGAHIFLPVLCFLSLWAIAVSNPAVVLLLMVVAGYLLVVLGFSAWWRRLLGASGEAEPVGAGKPSTRSVDEPEGGDKPQPEAAGRSRVARPRR
jgi:hypothetical protein